MKKKFACLVFSCAIVALLSVGDAALAKNNKGHGYRGERAQSSDVHFSIRIGAHDRDTIKSYLRRSYGKKCPPGLAKKNNGCLPPGIAKKYGIGRPLPDSVWGAGLPSVLADLLSPPPYGYQYVEVDRDILLIEKATRNVIDAVTLLSAVGD